MLEASTRRLRAYLDESFPFETTIRIVDNASTDATWEIATRLASTLPGVTALHLDQKGKGRAVRAAWSSSSAQIVAYMDVDLSTDLGALLPLVAPLLSGHSDVSIGSRFAPGAHVLRGARREAVSRDLQPLAAGRPAEPVQGCDMRLQGGPAGNGRAPAPPGARRSLVLRHRVPRLGGAKRLPYPRGPGRLGRRRRLAGQRRRRGQGGPARRRPPRSKSSHRPGTSRQHPAGPGITSIPARPPATPASGILSTVAYLAVFFLLRNQLGMFAANIIAMAVSTIGNTIAHVCFTLDRRAACG